MNVKKLSTSCETSHYHIYDGHDQHLLHMLHVQWNENFIQNLHSVARRYMYHKQMHIYF